MSSYLMVHWRHGSPAYPILLYAELDEERMETRKVDIFRDGRVGVAGPGLETEATGTFLAYVAAPALDEIARDPEFIPRPIEQDEFEAIWHVALRLGGAGDSRGE